MVAAMLSDAHIQWVRAVLALVGVASALGALVLSSRQRRLSGFDSVTARHDWNGAALDANPLIARLAPVRRDYIAALHGRSHASPHRAGRLTSTRKAVAALPYFRDRPPPPGAGEDQEALKLSKIVPELSQSC